MTVVARFATSFLDNVIHGLTGDLVMTVKLT